MTLTSEQWTLYIRSNRKAGWTIESKSMFDCGLMTFELKFFRKGELIGTDYGFR